MEPSGSGLEGLAMRRSEQLGPGRGLLAGAWPCWKGSKWAGSLGIGDWRGGARPLGRGPSSLKQAFDGLEA